MSFIPFEEQFGRRMLLLVLHVMTGFYLDFKQPLVSINVIVLFRNLGEPSVKIVMVLVIILSGNNDLIIKSVTEIKML